jgi:hypothetical protein
MSASTGPPDKRVNPPNRQERGAHQRTFPGYSSAAVSWWSVHEHVSPFLESAGTWPMAGTPDWCGLPDDHPAKLAALLDAAQHWALRVETCQVAESEASHAISAAVDWSAVARANLRHANAVASGAYIPRQVIA